MMYQILKFYFKLSRKEHLTAFMDGLANAGEPAKVFFPFELIEQGLALALSGLNNTMATQSNPGWVWPYWLERQTAPQNTEFIPTGVNVVTVNLTHRNWTSLGIPASSRECMVDPVGMLTPKPWGHSILPFVKFMGMTYLPQRISSHQTLDGSLPRVITVYDLPDGLQWRSIIQAVNVAGEELIIFTHEFLNSKKHPVDFQFGLALRPYNPLTIGHINFIKYKKRLWRVNFRPSLLLSEEPDYIGVSNRHHGDPLFGHRIDQHEISSRSGIVSGVAMYNRTLPAGESLRIECYAIIGKTTDHPDAKFNNVNSHNLDRARSEFVQYYNDNLNKGLMISFPDERYGKFFNALKNHIEVFDDGDHFSPGTFFYHAHWVRDSSFISLAYENLGWQDRMEKKIGGLLRLQKRNGFFRSQNGEWDSNGQAIFTVTNHIRHSGDANLARAVYPLLLAGARWIDTMRRKNRRKECRGLLPAGISSEHFGPNDHFYWDNFWSLAGLKELLWLTHKLGHCDKWLAALIDDYASTLEVSMERSIRRHGEGVLPCSPTRGLDCAVIGNLVAISPLNLYPATAAWVKPTVDFIFKNYVQDGQFFQTIIHTGFNPYLSIQLARVLLLMDDPRLGNVIDGLMQAATGTMTWPEAINPRSGGGCMGDGDHGWVTAEFLTLLRALVVFETADSLSLCAGFRVGKSEAEVVNASTRFGTLSFSLTCDRFLWSLRRNGWQDQVPIKLSLGHGRFLDLDGNSGCIPLSPSVLEK